MTLAASRPPTTAVTSATAAPAATSAADGLGLVTAHLAGLDATLAALARESGRLAAWGEHLAAVLLAGGRLLAAGNGGSAAEAQHLTAELVGRFRDDRPAFSALALTSETSSLTAIGNDYGFDALFARQVEAHGRAGDVLVALSTSGRSANLLRAAERARELGMTVWALVGAPDSPLAAVSDDTLALPGTGANVQEAQLVAIHALCHVFDAAVSRTGGMP